MLTNTSKIERETMHNNNAESGAPAPSFDVSGQTRDEGAVKIYAQIYLQAPAE